MAKKSDSKVSNLRNGILAFIAVLVIGVIAWGTLYSTGAGTGEFEEGTHYEVLSNPERQRGDGTIQVAEFFSYGCIHCKNFDPLIEDWLEEQAADVEFVREPVSFSAQWGLLAAAYRALESIDALDQNHERIFRAIHDQGRQFNTPDDLGEFVDGNGTTKNDFLKALNSREVRQAMRQSDVRQRNFEIASTPTLVIAGKYSVNMDHGRKMALEIVDHLIAKERAERAGGTAAESG